MVVPLSEMGTKEEERVWGMLGEGSGMTKEWQLRHCVPEAGHLEGRDRMYKKRMGRGLRLSGWQVPS